MTPHPPIKLSVLRDIGWRSWDPIGLLAEGDSWDGKPFADEYDNYLLHVVGLSRDGAPRDEAFAYLNWVRSEHMGLGRLTEAAHAASKTTVENIAAFLCSLGDD